MLASIFSVAQDVGYPLLFFLVMIESAGVPSPGETALITGGVVASQGKLEIEIVIAVAASAAIIGDNLGYLVARRYGPSLLQAPGPFARQRRRVLEVGVPFFERHGPKAVFFGRWILGLRTWASWLAGATHMPRRSFTFWNAAGGISWAATVGLVAFFVGRSAAEAVKRFGLYGLLGAVVVGAVILVVHHRRGRHDPVR